MALTSIGSLLQIPCVQMGYLSEATLDAAEEHIAFVLQVPKSGTLKKIAWRTAAVTGSSYTLRVSIETVADAVGAPVATTDAGKTLYASGAVSDDITSVSSNTIYYTSINGTSGISVTKGDFISVVIRMLSVSSSSVKVVYDPYGRLYGIPSIQSIYMPYTYTYLNGAAGTGLAPIVALEYDGELVPVIGCCPPFNVSTPTWNSGSNPDRRGLAITPAVKVRVIGANIYCDLDSDTDLIAYDSDRYTVMSGFPVTIDKDKRRGTSAGSHIISFSTPITLEAGQTYRFALLPKSTTNIGLSLNTFTNDGSILGITALPEGSSCIYTTFNGTPTSESNTWTDTNTIVPYIALLIDQIDISTGSGGSSPRFGDMTGGIR